MTETTYSSTAYGTMSSCHSTLRRRPGSPSLSPIVQGTPKLDDMEAVETTPIVRDLESGLQRTSPATVSVSCSICFDDNSGVDELFYTNPSCSHTCCRSCLDLHIENCLASRRYPIPCVMMGEGCTNRVPDAEVRQDDREQQRILRLCQGWVPCPNCEAMVPPAKDDAGAIVSTPVCSCPTCSHMFCRMHGNAHALNISCEEYEREHRLVVPRGDEGEDMGKPCSRCGVRLMKEGGCDMIVCPSCHKGMCYACGTHIHLVPIATGEMCRQCSLGNMTDRQVASIQCFAWVCLPFFLLGFLIFVLLASLFTFIFVVITLGCFCFYGCGKKIGPEFELNPIRGVFYTFLSAFMPLFGILFDVVLDRRPAWWESYLRRMKASGPKDDDTVTAS